MSINRVTVSGNLTRSPELRQTQGGMSILSFGVAVNDRRKNNQTGQWEDVPNFIDVVVFGKRAESLANILRKGMKLAIDGKLRYSSWEKDGQKRSKIEVVADDVDLMQQKGNQSQPQASQGQQYQQPNNYTNQGQYAPQNGYQQPTQQYQQQGYQRDYYDENQPF